MTYDTGPMTSTTVYLILYSVFYTVSQFRHISDSNETKLKTEKIKNTVT